MINYAGVALFSNRDMKIYTMHVGNTMAEKQSKIKFIIFCILPALLCATLYFLYDDKNPDSALGILFGGLLLTCVFCPLYLTIVCRYFSIKKSLKYSSCVFICLLINLLANFTLIINLGITTGWTQGMILWMLPTIAISMSVMVIGLLIIKQIKRRHDKEK